MACPLNLYHILLINIRTREAERCFCRMAIKAKRVLKTLQEHF